MTKVLFSLVISLLLWHSSSSFASEECKLLKNAKIYSMGEKDVIEKGMILIKGEKIEKIGEIIDLPPEAGVLDLSGKFIMPGTVCASSSLYIYQKDLALKGEGSPDTDILEGVDYFDSSIPEILSHGVTTAYISPVSSQLIKGLGAVVKLRIEPIRSLEILKEKAGLGLSLERMQVQRTTNLLRLSQYHRIRNLFKAAQDYRKEWEDYKRKLKEYEEVQKGKSAEKKIKEPKKPKKDEASEVLLQVLDKKIPVRLEAHRADSILNALRLKEEFELSIVLEGAGEWPAALSLLKEESVPLLSNPLLDFKRFMLPGGVKGYAASFLKIPGENFFYSEFKSGDGPADKNWNSLIDAKIPLSIIPPDSFPFSAKHLRFCASILVSQAVPVREALKAITTAPAQILGVASRVGSLEQGKDADLVVLDGEPLNTLSKIEMVFINGKCLWKRQE